MTLSEIYRARAAEPAAQAKSATASNFKERFERMALVYERLAEKYARRVRVHEKKAQAGQRGGRPRLKIKNPKASAARQERMIVLATLFLTSALPAVALDDYPLKDTAQMMGRCYALTVKSEIEADMSGRIGMPKQHELATDPWNTFFGCMRAYGFTVTPCPVDARANPSCFKWRPIAND